MSEFIAFFRIGIEHILCWDATDHVLFLMVLIFSFHGLIWKRVLKLISGFTLGHFISLYFLLKYDLGSFGRIIEVLIAITILFTALYNLFTRKKQTLWLEFIVVVVFGLIHGIGFSGTISMLFKSSDDVIIPVLAFNLGVELAQIFLVCLMYIFLYFWNRFRNKIDAWLLLSVNILVVITSLYWVVSRIISL